MVSASRTAAYEVLLSIEESNAHSDDAIHSKVSNKLQPRDRGLVTEIVYGSLRWQGLLDYILSQLSSRPWEKVSKGARVLLRMGLYQMWKMDRIPDHALVNDAVEIAKRHLERGTEGFVNGVLRNALRERPWEKGMGHECPKWTEVSLPRWLWDRWMQRFGGSQARAFALSLNEHPAEALRIESVESLKGPLVSEMHPSEIVPGAWLRSKSGRTEPSEERGRLPVQDEASQLIPHLLGQCDNWRVWDACAAPGGKSAILRSRVGAAGVVVSSDYSRRRALKLAQTLGAVQGAASWVIVADAAARPPFRIRFDAVLADVPCSGLGTLRRNPEIKWRFNPERFLELQKHQLTILEATSEGVKLGGRLIYSTCSTEPEENEQVVEAFLGSHPEFCIQKPDQPAGIEAWVGSDSYLRTFPSARLWDGFFAALMFRTS